MFKPTIAALLFCFASTSFAQLTYEQKVTDFKTLVGLYDKQYGPYDWKIKVFNFDALNIEPWLSQVESSHSDLEFYDICVRYVASLHDSHDEFTLPSSYEAFLPFTADIYSGKVLIDFVDQTILDPATYPFTIGDTLVSVDGKSVDQWIAELGPYSINGEGNPVSRDRIAVAAMLDRYQAVYPFASRIHPGDMATIVVKSPGGKSASYSVPWQVVGIPVTSEGPVPNPGGDYYTKHWHSKNSNTMSMHDLARATTNHWGIWNGARPSRQSVTPANGVQRMTRHHSAGAFKPDHTVAGSLFPFDPFFPAFNPPPGFKLRLGGGPTDEFVSGTFPVNGNLVGFIHIPSFEPTVESNALAQFQAEITYFNQNTKALVVDLMENGGGDICYANYLVQFLDPNPFKALPFRLRATEQWLMDFESLLQYEEEYGTPSDIQIALNMLEKIQTALAEERGFSEPVQIASPLSCNGFGGNIYPPATDGAGSNVAYTKPILVLTDNFTLSAAELFSATLQDEKRITVYGVPTDGGGGNVVGYTETLGTYGEGSSRVTQSLAIRNHKISAPGFPPAPYIENIGIQPDVFAPFNTKENLLTGGAPFVSGFEAVLNTLIGH